MRKFLGLVLVLAVVVAAVGYWRGWFTTHDKQGKVDVEAVPTKFKQDKETFTKSVGAKAKELKDRVESLWKKSETLTGDEKAQAQKELADLKKKHERLELQIKELDAAGQDRFDSIKQDLEKTVEEVEKKTEELTKKLDKAKAK